MEYVPGGELFEYICKKGTLNYMKLIVSNRFILIRQIESKIKKLSRKVGQNLFWFLFHFGELFYFWFWFILIRFEANESYLFILIHFDSQFGRIFIHFDLRFNLILFIFIRFDFDSSRITIHQRIMIHLAIKNQR